MLRFFRWVRDVWRYLLLEQWSILQNDYDHQPSRKMQHGTAIVLCWSAVALTALEYYGHSGSIFFRWFRKALPDSIYSPSYRHIYWSLACSACYFLFPLIAILLSRSRLRDYGLRIQGFWQHAWIYLVLYLIMLPAAITVSYTSSFQNTYPFYHLASRSWLDLGIWWTFYGMQFFFLEFFFRGYMLHGTKPALGAYAIFVSTLPYCMIHYGKPMPETLGAIIAGVVLGTLSMRTHSIWAGFLTHITVAYSMDILSLWQKGKLSLFM